MQRPEPVALRQNFILPDTAEKVNDHFLNFIADYKQKLDTCKSSCLNDIIDNSTGVFILEENAKGLNLTQHGSLDDFHTYYAQQPWGDLIRKVASSKIKVKKATDKDCGKPLVQGEDLPYSIKTTLPDDEKIWLYDTPEPAQRELAEIAGSKVTHALVHNYGVFYFGRQKEDYKLYFADLRMSCILHAVGE